MRAFIAIELPCQIKDSILKIQDKLKISLPKVSWVKTDNLHITLKFLGEISTKQLSAIEEIVNEIAGKTTSFKFTLENAGVFPSLSRARIIWIGTDNMPLELKEIVDYLEIKLAQLGFAKEERIFQAHITIGRIKLQIEPSDLEKAVTEVKNDISGRNIEFDVKGITIFQSTLGAKGPAYEVLKEAKFKIT